jgi:hypothetical protein
MHVVWHVQAMLTRSMLQLAQHACSGLQSLEPSSLWEPQLLAQFAHSMAHLPTAEVLFPSWQSLAQHVIERVQAPGQPWQLGSLLLLLEASSTAPSHLGACRASVSAAPPVHT